MARLKEVIPELHAALTSARSEDMARIDEGLRRFGMTGVHGEPEVGVTRLIDATIRQSGHDAICIDLVGATDEAYVAWVLARELAATVLDRTTLSLMGLPVGLRPTSADRAFIGFAEQVGQAVASLARSDSPQQGVSVGNVLEAIGGVYEQAVAPPVLWIDHLQAPRLTPRHPVDVNEVLWNVRALQQRVELPVILSGSRAATPVAYSENGAFHGDGVWLEIDRPSVETWVAAGLAGLPDNSWPSSQWIVEMATITHQHPSTMLLALALASELTPRTPLEMWHLMLSLDDGHAARAMEHARTLNRLGGGVLENIARGAGPYASRKNASIQEIHRALGRLHEAGLITQPAERQWEVTNPLVAARLRGELPMSSGDAVPRVAHDEDQGSAPL